MEELNWIAIALSTLSGIIVGALWHSPLLFGKMFSDPDGKDQKGHQAYVYIIHIISLVLISIFLSFATEESSSSTNFENLHHGVIHGFYICLLLVIPIIATNSLFEGRDWKYILSVCGNWVVSILIMAAIISYFG